MTESEWARKYTKMLQGGGAVVLSVVGGEMQELGWPDRYIVHRRWTGWLENKVRAPLSTLQAHRLEKLRERGVPAFCLRTDFVSINFECGDELVLDVSYDAMMVTWQAFLCGCTTATRLATEKGLIWTP